MILDLLSIALAASASVANAVEIKTGRDLVAVCAAYIATADNADTNARRPNDCRTFLQGFAVALKAREDARLEAKVKGTPYASNEACIRMPDFISFRELASRIVNFAKQNQNLLNAPPSTLAQKTLEHDFPCPPPPPRHQ